MSKHTPGPWRYGAARNYTGFYIAPDFRLPTLAAVKDDSIAVFNFPGETEPNARLIAAAPQMLEALKSIEYFVQEDFANGPDGETCAADSYRGAYKQLLEAIKLAEGE